MADKTVSGNKATNTRVLVVEDEEYTRQLLRDLLEEEGYAVGLASDGQEGIKAIFEWRPALVVIDIMMPKMDGWKLLERIREVSDVPVIILTALGQENDKVRGLRGGADDYVVKPVPVAEFAARVDAALRKHKVVPKTQQVYDDKVLRVDALRHQVLLRGVQVELSPQEFRVLVALVHNAGVVLSAEQLLDLCWGEGEGGQETLRVYIGNLRKKLGEDPKKTRLIETVREFGYRYNPPLL